MAAGAQPATVSRTHGHRWLIASEVAIACAFCAVFVQFTIDDAFISFRYAKNLVELGVWNWNPSGGRVEAYTSAIYAALAVVPISLGIAPVHFFKLLGAALGTALFARVSSDANGRRFLLALAVLTLLNPYFYMHVFSCLETPLYMFLIFELIRVVGSDLQGPRYDRYFYGLLLAMPLCRPEGAALAVVALAVHMAFNRHRIREWRFFAAVVAFGSAYFAWRWWYFGQPLPNTFYVKTGESPADLEAAFDKNLPGVKFYLLLIGIVIGSVHRRSARVLIIGCTLLYLALYGWSSKLYSNYADRFAFQLIVPAVLAGLLFVQVTRMRQIAITGAAILLVLLQLERGDLLIGTATWPQSLNLHADIGRRLAKYRDRGYTMMLGDAGALPYYSGWKAVDLFGLANVRIAREGMSRALMEEEMPDLIFLYSKRPSFTGIRDGSIKQFVVKSFIRQHRQRYAMAGAHLYAPHSYILSVLRTDIPDYAAIRAELQQNQRKTELKNLDMSFSNREFVADFFRFSYLW
jgi:arabinofuranosyltransferase